MELNSDAYGNKFSNKKYHIDGEEIKRNSILIDNLLNCYGAGFMIHFFIYSKDAITKFQDSHGGFPYDICLDMWTNFENSFGDSSKNSYSQRNRALGILSDNGYIKEVKNKYYLVKLPSVIQRKKNLESLLGK